MEFTSARRPILVILAFFTAVMPLKESIIPEPLLPQAASKGFHRTDANVCTLKVYSLKKNDIQTLFCVKQLTSACVCCSGFDCTFLLDACSVDPLIDTASYLQPQILLLKHTLMIPITLNNFCCKPTSVFQVDFDSYTSVLI